MPPSQETSGDGHDTASDGSGLREQAGQGLNQAYAAALAGNGHLDPPTPSGLEGHGHNDPHAGGNGNDLMGLGMGGAQEEEAEDNAGGAGGKRPKPPRPDTVAPCPRCGSAETKFCYYNNYNVKQPRYFCKACQRYWTAGGTLRNVPPGSGRRKSKSQAAKEQEKQSALAEQLAKQSVASAMLAANPAGLAAAVPFLNPMLAAESTMLAYNAAAQQQLLGTAALNALSSLPKMSNLSSQWPGGMGNGNGLSHGSGNLGSADSPGIGSPSGNNGGNGGNGGNGSNALNGGQGSGLLGDDQLTDLSGGHPAKRPKLESSGGAKHDTENAGLSQAPSSQPMGGNNGGGGSNTSAAEEAAAANMAAANAAASAAANAMSNSMAHHHMSGAGSFQMPNGQLVSLGNGWPGMSAEHAMALGMGGQGMDPTGMMGGAKNGQAAAAAAHNAAAAAQNALQQQHMAYQQMIHAQLLQQQMAAQAQVAAGLGQPNPYLSLQHLAAYNPFNYGAGNPSLANLGFNPTGGR